MLLYTYSYTMRCINYFNFHQTLIILKCYIFYNIFYTVEYKCNNIMIIFLNCNFKINYDSSYKYEDYSLMFLPSYF